MKKGINAWCFPAGYTLEQTFCAAKAQGYEGIELNIRERTADDDTAESPLSLTLGMGEAEYEYVRSLSARYELPVYSVSSGLQWIYPLTEGDADKRSKAISVVRQMIEAASALGAGAILVVPGLVTESVSYRQAYERSQDALNELKTYAETKKVIIGIENVWNKFLLSPLEMRRFLDEINSPWVKMYFDAGNVLQFSYPEHWVEVLGDVIVRVHIKDFDTGIGNISGFKPLMQGSMNWARLVNALRKAGYEGYLTPELSPYPTNPAQLLADTSQALDYILSLE